MRSPSLELSRLRIRGKCGDHEIMDRVGVIQGFIKLFTSGHRLVGTSWIAKGGRVGREHRSRMVESRKIGMRFRRALYQSEKVVGLWEWGHPDLGARP